MSNELRYTDPELKLQTHPSEITPSTISTITELLKEHLTVKGDQVPHWFGEYMTEFRSGTQNIEPDEIIQNYKQFEALLANSNCLCHSPTSRFLFSRNNNTTLYVDGSSYQVSHNFAENICAQHAFPCAELDTIALTAQDRETLIKLYNLGCLFFSNEAC